MMRTRTGAAVVAVLAVCGALVTGCGDDGGEADGETTRAAWIAQADAYCAAGDERVERAITALLGDATPGTPEFDRLQARIPGEVVVPDLQRLSGEIADIPVPAGDEDEVGAIMTELRAAIADAERDPLTLMSPDSRIGEATRLAAAYGSQVCGAE